MNFKTTYTLFGVLIVAYALFALNQSVQLQNPGEEFYVMADLRKANVPSKDITSIEIERNRPEKEKLVFTRDPETKHWKLESPYAARIETDEAINRIFNEVQDARRVEQAERPTGASQAGLDPPAAVVTVTARGRPALENEPGRPNHRREGQGAGLRQFRRRAARHHADPPCRP